MKNNNTIAKISLYFSLSILMAITFYQVYSKNNITNNELNLVYPFFFLILSLFHIIKNNEIRNTELNQKTGFKNLEYNWDSYKNKPLLIVIITALAITYSILLRLSGEKLFNIPIIIFLSIALYTTIIFTVSNKVIKILFWFNFYFWQISFIISLFSNYNVFFIDNINPFGSLIPSIFQNVF